MTMPTMAGREYSRRQFFDIALSQRMWIGRLCLLEKFQSRCLFLLDRIDFTN